MKQLSLEGFGQVKHFEFHRQVLQQLKGSDEVLADELPSELDLFAFFTEVVLCPTKRWADIPLDVPERCFSMNASAFIEKMGFPFIVALGKAATEQAVAKFCPGHQISTLERNWSNRLFEGLGHRFVISSRHPSYEKYPPSPSIVAKLLLRASRRSGITLYQR